MRTKITKALTVIALGALALTGCAAPNSAVPDGGTYELSTSEKVAIGTDMLREEFPRQMRGFTDAEVAELMYTFCDAVDKGMTFEDYVIDVLGNDVSVEFGGAVAGVSIATVCPEHTDWID